ncbi:chromosome segregation protein spc25 [Ceratobasidium sp. AG-Ba]|nr:chromosome segregation protein spc25 [Ceratobasidium sp. AG-Ba]
MDASSVPTPTRKGTLPGQPLASPAQHSFPPHQHQQQQQQHPQQFQWPHNTGTPPPGPYYPYANYPQGYFPPDQQQQHQFAQWAFQQMMFNSAQQQQLSTMPGVPDFARQRTGSGAAQDYAGFPPGAMIPPHLGFQPSGTPPPHPHPHAGGHALHPMQYSSIGRASGTDHQGFHPYRRPGGGQQQQQQQSPRSVNGPSEFGAQQQFNSQYGTVPFAGGYPAGYPHPRGLMPGK